MITASEDRKGAFGAGHHFEACNPQLRRAKAALLEHELHRWRRLFIGEQTEEITGVTQDDWKARRHFLGTGSIRSKANHFEDVRAFEAN